MRHLQEPSHRGLAARERPPPAVFCSEGIKRGAFTAFCLPRAAGLMAAFSFWTFWTFRAAGASVIGQAHTPFRRRKAGSAARTVAKTAGQTEEIAQGLPMKRFCNVSGAQKQGSGRIDHARSKKHQELKNLYHYLYPRQ